MLVKTKKNQLKEIVVGSRIVLNSEGGEVVTVTGEFKNALLVKYEDGKTSMIDPLSIWDVIEAVKKVVTFFEWLIGLFKKKR